MTMLKVTARPMDMHPIEIENGFIELCPQFPSSYHRPRSLERNALYETQQGDAVT